MGAAAKSGLSASLIIFVFVPPVRTTVPVFTKCEVDTAPALVSKEPLVPTVITFWVMAPTVALVLVNSPLIVKEPAPYP